MLFDILDLVPKPRCKAMTIMTITINGFYNVPTCLTSSCYTLLDGPANEHTRGS